MPPIASNYPLPQNKHRVTASLNAEGFAPRAVPSYTPGVPVTNASSSAYTLGRQPSLPLPPRQRRQPSQDSTNGPKKGGFFYYIVYAMVNVIISVPGLYGYAAVIFNHEAYNDHMNALSKLVIFSSLMHQLGFCLFSSLPFAIGTVQDAGLIFLSAMSNIVAKEILANGGTVEEVVSTTLVILAMSTACLGLALVAMGKFRLADIVSYLPMPVVGGYLAFIGYFCLQAGVALCISEPMVGLADWRYLLESQNVLLAAPGLGAGLALTYISRKAESDAALPAAMIVIPVLFYALIFGTGMGIEGAREDGWVGQTAPPVPVQDLFHLVGFKLVHWTLISKCLATWLGMVFVVSFASCLDVAAISMDMGEALDTNRELATVGICNVMSGLTFGFTGSYIFSQTIFTYRTGVHSKWIGVIIMIVFLAVVLSTVNMLQVAPLFFLGSTLIFIGYDLLYEWLFEIRHKIFLSEYVVLWLTFLAIQVVGINAGIVFGVVVAMVDHVMTTARVSALNRVPKRSRAVWSPEHWKILQTHGYHSQHPKIVTYEIIGSVFFGTGQQLLSTISDEIGIDATLEEVTEEAAIMSPHRAGYLMTKSPGSGGATKKPKSPLMRPRPHFLVLDLAQMPNLDASAARGCFLQLAKMCSKRHILVCAAGLCPRVDWMLRAHDVAYDEIEGERIKQDMEGGILPTGTCDKILPFLTIYEALEFCESQLIQQLDRLNRSPSFIGLKDIAPSTVRRKGKATLAEVFSFILGLREEDKKLLDSLSDETYHQEMEYNAGDCIFPKDTHSDSFGVVLKGAVANVREELSSHLTTHIVSGAGKVSLTGTGRSTSNLMDQGDIGHVRSFLSVGGIFGFVDFLLEHHRSFRSVASRDKTVVAKITRAGLDRLQEEHPEVVRIVQSVLLQASAMELSNCTCSD
jgi:SulP family sulfate permease